MTRPVRASLYLIFSILFLLFTDLAFAVFVKARILDSNGKPVQDVTVYDGRKHVYSGADGSFSIETRAAELTFSRLGYKKLTLAVKDISGSVSMHEEPVVLPVVRVIERYETAFSNALDKTVISTDAEKTAVTTADILLQESAFHTSETRLAGENQTLSLLGNLSRHTLIMLDNVPLNPHGEPFDLSSLPLKNIKRIEIVKGNASLYGGASAIGGIVYLFTENVQTAHPLKLEHNLAIGSFNQIQQSLSYEQQSPLLSYRVLVSCLSADNDFKYKPRPWWNLSGDLTRDNNRKEQQNVALQISSNPDPFSIKYKLDVDNIYRQLPGPVNFLELYKNAYLTGQKLLHSLSFGSFYNNLSNQLLLWQNLDETEYNNTRATNPVYPTNYRQNQTSLGLKNLSAYSYLTITADLGLEHSQQTYERHDLIYPLQSIDPEQRNLTAISLKAKTTNEIDFFTNQFQAGARLDKVSDFDSFVSWRLEELLSYDGLVQMQAGAAWGSSFSLPSFYDLYWKGDAQSLGNPDLEPETSIGGNIWLAINYTNYSVKAAWYKNQVEKLIQWRQTYLYGTAWKPVNIGKASMQNWEFNAEANPLTWLALRSSLTLTNARDEELDKRLTYTPEAKWITNLILSYRNCTFVLSRDYTGRQWKTPDNLLDPIPAFALYGAGLSYSFSYKKLQSNLSLHMNNLFDKQDEIYDYVPQSGFHWQSGIILSLSL